ncbi:vegetative cell wall protein gp1-like, partial [Penaeus chinensis]|uniref:vegetative cell wall protein gp1-like n=1 Tax=Penaeus chinensis TaxID=139456 RepID=UPI001FB7BE26
TPNPKPKADPKSKTNPDSKPQGGFVRPLTHRTIVSPKPHVRGFGEVGIVSQLAESTNRIEEPTTQNPFREDVERRGPFPHRLRPVPVVDGHPTGKSADAQNTGFEVPVGTGIFVNSGPFDSSPSQPSFPDTTPTIFHRPNFPSQTPSFFPDDSFPDRPINFPGSTPGSNFPDRPINFPGSTPSPFFPNPSNPNPTNPSGHFPNFPNPTTPRPNFPNPTTPFPLPPSPPTINPFVPNLRPFNPAQFPNPSTPNPLFPSSTPNPLFPLNPSTPNPLFPLNPSTSNPFFPRPSTPSSLFPPFSPTPSPFPPRPTTGFPLSPRPTTAIPFSPTPRPQLPRPTRPFLPRPSVNDSPVFPPQPVFPSTGGNQGGFYPYYFFQQPPLYDYGQRPNYGYAYDVNDPHTGNFQGKQETSEDGIVRGSYHLLQPDGRVRVVTYHADDATGFKADVEYLPAGGDNY